LSKSGISDEIRKFIIENISSVGQLEVLFLLYKKQERAWNIQEVGEELRSSETAAAEQLRGLHERELIIMKCDGKKKFVSYLASAKNDAILKLLLKCYDDYRVSIITLIYEKPVEAIRSFANAFRIKKG
jgi:hypothetical protein